MVRTRDGRMNSPISYSPWERHYPGREVEEEKLTARKRLKKRPIWHHLSQCIPFLHCSELPSRNVFYFPTFWTFPDKRMLFCFHAATPYNSWSAFDMQWSLHNMKQGNWMSSTLLSFCQEDTQLAFDRKLEWRYATKIWSARWLTIQGYSTNWDQLGQIAAILRVRLPKSIESCEPVSHITLLADCSVNIIMLR